MQSSTKETGVNWVNGVKENGANFQPKEHGANFQPKEMPNYLEGGSRMVVKCQTSILGQCLWFYTWSEVV